MSVCITDAVFRHCRASVQQLTKRNFKAVVQELVEICDSYGAEARAYFIACLYEELDHKEGKANHHAQKVAVISSELQKIVQEEDFVTHINNLFHYLSSHQQAALSASYDSASKHSKAVRHGKSYILPHDFPVTEETLQQILEHILNLPLAGQISVATALCFSPDSFISSVSCILASFADRAYHGYVGTLQASEAYLLGRLQKYVLSGDETTLSEADLVFGQIPVCVVKAVSHLFRTCPLLSASSLESQFAIALKKRSVTTSGISSVPTINNMDIGYEITSSTQAFREALASIRRGSRHYGLVPLSEGEVARLLVAMGNSLNLFMLGAHEPTVGPVAVAGAANPAALVGPVLDSLAAAAGAMGPYGGRNPTHPPHPDRTWQHDAVAAVLREDHYHLDWHLVIASLDFPDCSLTSPHAFHFVVAVTRVCTGGNFPISELLKKPFTNTRAHADALRHAVATPVELISFKQDGVRLLTPITSIGSPNYAWCCVDLYHVLFKIAQVAGGDTEAGALHIIDQAQAAVPELVLFSIAKSKVDDRVDEDVNGTDPLPARNRRCVAIMTTIFGNLFTPARLVQPNSTQMNVLTRLWDISRPLAATSLLTLGRSLINVATTEVDQLRFSLEGISRVVALTLLLPDFATVLLSAPTPQLAIEVAVYLSIAGPDVEARIAAEPVPQAWQGVNEAGTPSGTFKLEAWLTACMANTTPGAADRFAAACVAFLKRVVGTQQQILQNCRLRAGAPLDGSGAATSSTIGHDGQPHPTPASAAEQHAQEAAAKEAVIRAEVLIPIFRSLKNHSSSLTASTAAAVHAISDAASKVYPGLATANSQEIEELANTYFQRIYTSQQSMAEVIEMLKQFKNSADPREKEIFKCMIHNLFDEYRFFERYPDKELRITGILFGLLVQHQLVASATLGIALRYVLEALRKPPTNAANVKMYRFGKYALEQFKSRLPKWPQYCAHIVAIPHLREEHPDFVAEIEAAISGNGSGTLTSSVSLLTRGSMAPVGALESAEVPAVSAVSTPAAPAPQAAPTPTAGGFSRAALHQTLRAQLAALGEDLKVALAAASSGMQIPAILPSVAAAAVAAKEAEEKAAASGSLSFSSDSPMIGNVVAPGVEALIAAAGGMPNTHVPDSPVASLQDRINFIFNNMTEANTDVKATETLAVLKADQFPWFATVIVKRIAAMHNQQPMLRQYLDKINSSVLDAEILHATLDAIRRLIISDRIRSEARERSTLKNLGSWLGRITLSCNKPLLYLHMNPKSMLYEAYESGRLIAVLPFVSKVLEAAAESSVFKPPNPWTMALLGVLVELHEVIDLKINLKFEVEVLLKNLSLELKDVRPSHSLHLRRRPPLVNNPDFNAKAASNVDAVPGIPAWDEAQPTGTSHSSSNAPGGNPAIPGLLRLITLRAFSSIFYPNVPIPAPPPHVDGADPAAEVPQGVDEGAERDEAGSAKANLRNVVAVAVDRAVRELIQPAVDRSVTIAVITAKELITKDFAMESDADKMAHAAHAFVSDLAGSLCLVTCQDVLRASIGNHLRNLLTAHPGVITSLPVSVHTLGDTAVNAMLQNVVSENLDLASLLIEKAAMDKAIRSIDESLASAYAARRKAKESNTPFVDSAVYVPNSRWPGALPELLRARPAGLLPAQLRVYEASSLARAPAGPSAAPAAEPLTASIGTTVPTSAGVATSGSMGMLGGSGTFAAPPIADASGAQPGRPQLTPGQALQEYNVLLDRLTSAIKQTAAAIMAAHPGATGSLITPATLATLPESDLSNCLKELRAIGLRVAPGNLREDVCIVQAQKLFRGLFELPQPPATVVDALATQVYLAGLVYLNEVCRQLRKDIVTYLAFIPEDRRYSDTVILGLLRSQLVALRDFDVFLAKALDAGRNALALRFLMVLLYKAIISERLITAAELPNAIDALLAIASRAAGTAMAASNPAALPVPPALPVVIDALRAVSATQPGAVTPAALAEKTRNAAAALGIVAAPTSAAPAISLSGLPQAAPTSAPLATTTAAGDAPYSDAIRAQVLYLLEIWVRICAEVESGAASDKQYHAYLSNLGQQGVLQNDASTERFFRVMMDLCVQSCAATAKPHPATLPGAPADTATPFPRNRLTYTGVDALSKLVVVLVKVAEGMSAKVALFNKLIAIFARALIRDADSNGAGASPDTVPPALPAAEGSFRFDQRPYLRLFTNLLRDMYQQAPQPPAPGGGGAADEAAAEATRAAAVETAAFNAQILASFANVLHAVKPERVPGFAFAWLEMLCHRHFLPSLLAVPGQRGWPLVHRLLVDLFRFLYPALRRAEMNDAVKLMYKGSLRLLLVLHHDFPEFLADYHSSLLDVLPPSCIQLRNLLLTANPKAIKLPDPFQSSAHIEALPECTVLPRTLCNATDGIPPALRDALDAYLRTRAAAPLPQQLLTLAKAAIFAGADEQAFSLSKYSLTTTNALVVYLAQAALSLAQDEAAAANPAHLRGTVPASAILAAASSTSAATTVLRHLLCESDAEGRYAIFNAVANQLRYPNAHTLFFSRILLEIFVNPAATSPLADVIREQLTRVMLERVVVHRPQPWGLLVTFIELIKNPVYKFWTHPFTKMNADIERLFESVARSCMATPTPGE